MKKSILILLLVTACLMEVMAETYYYRASYRDDPATTIVIGWSGDEGSVHYGPNDEGTDHTLYPNVHAADRTVTHRGEDQHFARLSGLTPNTVYYFVIRDNTGAVSQRLSIQTLSDESSTPISFISGGDTRLGFNNLFEPCDCREARQDGNMLVAKLRPDFVAFNGDFVLNNFLIANQTNSQWRLWFEDWQLTIGPEGRLTPLFIATGNHEDDVDYPLVSDPNFKDAFNLFDVPNTKVYYAINFGGDLIRMYALNTELHGCLDLDQRNWLTNDLINYSAPSNTPYWKAANYHHPIVPHSNYNIRSDLRTCWAGLFDEYNVRLAMESHTHSMKTTYPLARSDSSGNDGGFVREDLCGTVYIGEGNWAAPQRSLYPPRDWTRQTASIRSFFYITVSRDSITVYSPEFTDIDNVIAATDNTLGSPPPAGLTLYDDAVNAADAGSQFVIPNTNEACGTPVTVPVVESRVSFGEIYPNPVKDVLRIQLKQPLSEVTFEVYDARGQQCDVFFKRVSDTEFMMDADQLCADVGIILIKANGDVEAHKFIRVK